MAYAKNMPTRYPPTAVLYKLLGFIHYVQSTYLLGIPKIRVRISFLRLGTYMCNPTSVQVIIQKLTKNKYEFSTLKFTYASGCMELVRCNFWFQRSREGNEKKNVLKAAILLYYVYWLNVVEEQDRSSGQKEKQLLAIIIS